MANNRISLRLKSKPDRQITLFKYYPSTGWYLDTTKEKIDEWLDKYINDEELYGEKVSIGNTDFFFEFEHE